MIGIFIALWKMYDFILFDNTTSPDAGAVLACAVFLEGFVEVFILWSIDDYLKDRRKK